MDDWKTYKNGNYTTMINLVDGTKIRETGEGDFIPDFAENMDIKCTDYCSMSCKFCHEGSSINGKHGDIMNEKFIDTLHPYQEVALGGGDITSHPDLIPFLRKLKEKSVIPNITVNQVHFEQKQHLIHWLVNEKLIYGIGVSLVNPTDEFIELVSQYSNAVIHVINGILKPSDVEKLSNHGLKILILGYKNLRRGSEYLGSNGESISKNQTWLYDNLPKIINGFRVVGFDNLAIEQLNVRRMIPDDAWDEFYMGDDGSESYYIDMVERKFAKNSTAPLNKRYVLLDNVDDMFNIIRNEG